jgi:hypothetical protein
MDFSKVAIPTVSLEVRDRGLRAARRIDEAGAQRRYRSFYGAVIFDNPVKSKR